MRPTFVFALCALAVSLGLAAPAAVLAAEAVQAEHVVLFVMEGVGSEVIRSGTAATLHRLADEGAVVWDAQSVSPPLAVPAMASVLTGLPVERHRVDREWETYDFSRSFLRAPTMFDYLDLAGGVDTALFIMDERLYQLSRPEIYVDTQTCGKTKPHCTPSTLVGYIEDYLTKVVSPGGYNFRIFAIPGLLVAHLPAPADVARKHGWNSAPHHAAIQSVDNAVADIITIYKSHNVLTKTMFIATALYGPQEPTPHSDVFWLASGANIKPKHTITRDVHIMDTGATIMAALGLNTHTEWNSHALTNIFQTTPHPRTTDNERLATR